MTSKLARTASKVAARTGLARQPLSQKTIDWLRLLIPLALILSLAFASLAPNGLVLPVYCIVSFVVVIGLPRTRDRVVVAGLCTLLMLFELVSSVAFSQTRPAGRLLNHGVALAILWILVISVSRHRRMHKIVRDNERVASERLAQLNTIYASAPVGLCFVDRDLRFISMNNALAELYGASPEFFLGKTVREAVPEIAAKVEADCQRVLDTGKPIIEEEVQSSSTSDARQLLCSLYSYYPVQNQGGARIGVNVAVRDITLRKQAESDTLFLLDLGEAIRFAADADELLWSVVVTLGEHLKLSRCAFFELAEDTGRLVQLRDYHRHLPSLLGTSLADALSALIQKSMDANRLVAISDIEHDPRATDHRTSYQSASIRACAVMPVARDDRVLAVLLAARHGPHTWTEREISLMNIVAERTWLAVEKLRLDKVLRESDAALRDADRRKDEFLATLAHELRNPLSLIRNVSALQNTPASPEHDPRWGQDIIERQVNYLTHLTDDLFDVSRITRDKLELQKERLNLMEVIHAAVEASRPIIEQRGHQLTLTASKSSVYVDADRVRLTQVFANLLNNAAKYTPNGGQIWLSAEHAGDSVVVRVKDTGIGIAMEDLPRLFDLFYQVDRSFTRAEGGLGLGLTLVQRLLEMHGGKVEVRSDGLSRGSEFTVHLTVVPEVSVASHGEPPHENGRTVSRPGRRILVADDFPQSAEILARLLRQDGNVVQIARDGMEALEAAAQFRPEVVVLDLSMPKLSGYEAARIIREQPWGKRMFLVALSGWGHQLDQQRTKESGFDAHLTKPAKYEKLIEVLKLAAAHETAQLVPDREL
ncbi:MAG TPA: ATP-binding protein [Candidatus Binatia bacterium]